MPSDQYKCKINRQFLGPHAMSNIPRSWCICLLGRSIICIHMVVCCLLLSDTLQNPNFDFDFDCRLHEQPKAHSNQSGDPSQSTPATPFL